MFYALLCYGCEDEIAALARNEIASISERCDQATRGPSTPACAPAVRLMPTSTAVTIRAGPELRTLDGPYVETREQLLGMWLLECDSLGEAVTAASRIAEARGMAGGALEVRPIAQIDPWR